MADHAADCLGLRPKVRFAKFGIIPASKLALLPMVGSCADTPQLIALDLRPADLRRKTQWKPLSLPTI